MKQQRGRGKLEIAVALIIFGILAHLLLERLVAVEHETERLEVSLTVRHIHLGIKLAIGEHLMRGEDPPMATLLQRNPLDFLEYGKVGGGGTARWQYDPPSHTLSYRPRQPEAFEGRQQLSWHFTAYTDERGRMAGLRLEPVAPVTPMAPHDK